MNTLKKFKNLVNLGYIWTLTDFIIRQGKRYGKKPFDYVAAPMWAVAELMENDFEDYLVDVEHRQVYSGGATEDDFCVDNRYYVQFPQSYMPQQLHKAIQRSVSPFLDFLRVPTADLTLFIRVEERNSLPGLGTRKVSQAYQEKYHAGDELYYLKQFCQTVKTKYPSFHFKVLFLNCRDDFVDNVNGIVGIKITKAYDYRSPTSTKDLEALIEAKAEWLAVHL